MPKIVEVNQANELVSEIFKSAKNRQLFNVDFCALDRAGKISYIKEFIGRIVFYHQIEPIEVITDPNYKRITYNASRQSGKSEGMSWAQIICAINNTHPALDDKTKIVSLANKASQTQIIGSRVRKLLMENYDRTRFFWDKEGSNMFKQVFKKESGLNTIETGTIDYITANPKAFSEGFTSSLMMIDEANKLDQTVYSEVVTPYLSSCVTEDTRILTSKGYRKIIDLKSEDRVWSLNHKTLEFELKKSTFIDNGIAKVAEVTLYGNSKIKVTYNEPFLIAEKDKLRWEKLENLQVGNYVAMGLPSAGENSTLTEFEGFLLGALIGDGCVSKKGTPQIVFGQHEFETRDAICKRIQEEHPLGISETKIYISDKEHGSISNVQLRSRDPSGIKRYSSPLRNKLIEFGMYGCLSHSKRIPEIIYQSTETIKWQFIAGLLVTDGSLGTYKGSGSRIEFMFSNELLCRDLQLLLHELGVRSGLYPINPTSRCSIVFDKPIHVRTNPWKVEIKHIKGMNIMIEKLPFLYHKENRRIELRKKIKNSIPLDKGDMIPVPSGYGTTYLEKASRDKALQKAKNQFAKLVASKSTIRWAKIVAIKDLGELPTYDLTVEDNHSYIAEGVILHNTNGTMLLTGVSRGKGPFYDACNSKDFFHLHYPWDKVETYSKSAPVDILHKNGTIQRVGLYPLEVMPMALKKIFFPENPMLHILPARAQKERYVPMFELSEGSMDENDFLSQYCLSWIAALQAFLCLNEQQLLFETGDFQPLTRGIDGEEYFFGLDVAGTSNVYASGNHSKDKTALSIWRRRNGNKEKVFCDELYSAQSEEIVNWLQERVNPSYGFFRTRFGAVDVTGAVGAFVSEHLQKSQLAIVPIIYNRTEPTTNKNYKNAMFEYFKLELNAGRIRYPAKEVTDELDENTLQPKYPSWYRARAEWEVIEKYDNGGINCQYSAPSSEHDDFPNSDILATFCMDREFQFSEDLKRFRKRAMPILTVGLQGNNPINQMRQQASRTRMNPGGGLL